MNMDKVFDGLGENNQLLWDKLQVYAEDLDLQPEDSKIFTTEEQSTLAFYINNYVNNLVSVGVHLARVRKIKTMIENKKIRYFGSEYVKITEECVSGKNSSKFDKEYRTGKVTEKAEYKELTTLLADVTELEGNLEAVKMALQTKATVLPTMFKLDRSQY